MRLRRRRPRAGCNIYSERGEKSDAEQKQFSMSVMSKGSVPVDDVADMCSKTCAEGADHLKSMGSDLMEASGYIKDKGRGVLIVY